MTKQNTAPSTSGASKTWADFARTFQAEMDEFAGLDNVSSDDTFRDEYVRLPYEDLPANQECRW